jgi:glycosyltransferase involved in cell wall biosynthesis
VEWLPKVSDEELDQLYAKALASIYLSGTEGFGLPVVESLLRGTPCIASDRHAVGEVALAFGGCLRVDPDAPEAWVQAVETFLDDPGLRSRLVSTVRHERIRPWSAYAAELLGEMTR